MHHIGAVFTVQPAFPSRGLGGKLTQTTRVDVARAMAPIGQETLFEGVSSSEDGRPPTSRPCEERTNALLTAIEPLDLSTERDGCTPSPASEESGAHRSPQASCCDGPFQLRDSLLAGLSSLVSSSGYVVFSKDFIEAVFASALISHGLDPTCAPYNYLIASSCGIWYGLTHQVVSKFTAGLLNARLGLNRYSVDGSESERQIREFVAIALPALASYALCHSVRGLLTEGVSNTWSVGFAKLAASSLAGGVAGLITDVIRQNMPSGFRCTKPAPTTGENIRTQMSSICEDMTFRKAGHDFLGKIGGSVAGMTAAVPLAPLDLPGATSLLGEGAAQGALSKFIVQLGFYSGVHLGSAGGRAIDLIKAEVDAYLRNKETLASTSSSEIGEDDASSLVCSSDEAAPD